MTVVMATLLGCAAQSSLGQMKPGTNSSDSDKKAANPVAKLMNQPTLKTAQNRCDDVLTISVESAAAPDRLYADRPFRMMIDKDGKNQPELVARDNENPTFASSLRITIDPMKLGESDQVQFEA
jgi:hypothetical protein